MKRFDFRYYLGEDGRYHAVNMSECAASVGGGASTFAGAVPVNNVGDGAIAWVGQPEGDRNGEPGVSPKKGKRSKKKYLVFDTFERTK